jgi:SAM-dependent methyltransferase
MKKSQAWLATWKSKLQESMKLQRGHMLDQIELFEQTKDDDRPVLPRGCDLTAVLNRELDCEAISSSPMPYVLNVGCGFVPTSVGFRTEEGIPVTVVGVDPLAFAIGDVLAQMAVNTPMLMQARRFVLPIVAEELSAAIPPSSFHAVWSEDAFLDCVDPFRFLQQCVRACKEGGVVAVKFKPRAEGDLWSVMYTDGGKIALKSERGEVALTEIRGERIEVHTLMDESLLIKVRRQPRSIEQVQSFMKKSGLILPR